MNRRTRAALELLREYKRGYLTVDATGVGGSRKAPVLFVNLTTGLALERRGLAKIVDEDDGAAIELVA